jgi:hypothetical protein
MLQLEGEFRSINIYYSSAPAENCSLDAHVTHF